jgi:hypothetical protein
MAQKFNTEMGIQQVEQRLIKDYVETCAEVARLFPPQVSEKVKTHPIETHHLSLTLALAKGDCELRAAVAVHLYCPIQLFHQRVDQLQA